MSWTRLGAAPCAAVATVGHRPCLHPSRSAASLHRQAGTPPGGGPPGGCTPGGGLSAAARSTRCTCLPPPLPQNTENPMVVPSTAFSAEAAVRVQLEALQANDVPWSNHGVQTAYEFALGVGGMDPCPYFLGQPLDLYHQDHFQGKFLNKFPEMVGLTSFSIDAIEELAAGGCPSHAVSVTVVGPRGDRASFRFLLAPKLVGRLKGALATHVIERMP